MRRVLRAVSGSAGHLIADGYPLLLDGEGAARAPGWSAAPGDVVGFALSGTRAATGSLRITDATGNVVQRLPAVRLAPQPLAGEEPWRTGAAYPVACTWRIDAGLKSGMYFLEGRSDLFVVVREGPPARSPVAVLISTNTFNAYSRTASASLYRHPTQVPEVSFCRPFDQVKDKEWRAYVEWMVAESPFGADARYLTDVDMESEGALDGVKVLIVLGHSEYWTRRAREAFDAHLARGGHAVIAGGNVMKWQVRYGPGFKSLISYKKAALNPPQEGGDPVEDVALKTTRWYDEVLRYPTVRSIGGDFRMGGYGVFRHPMARGWGGMRVVDATHPLLQGLGLQDGDLIQLYRVTECDGAPIKGLDARGRPLADAAAIGATRLEILAYDWTYRGGHTMATVHLMQPGDGTGTVLHLGAKECVGSLAFHPSARGGGALIRGIVRNAVRRMLENQPLFRGGAAPAVVHPLATPHKGALPAGIEAPWAPRAEAAG